MGGVGERVAARAENPGTSKLKQGHGDAVCQAGNANGCGSKTGSPQNGILVSRSKD